MTDKDYPQIIVVGSLNVDLVIRVPRFPQPGETLPGGDLQTISGGKGANQAAAAARLGNQTALIGKVGDDPHGKMLVRNLNSFQVDTTRITADPDAPTGSAVIMVNEAGENSIVLSPGANDHFCPEDLRSANNDFSRAKFLLLQLEIPLSTVEFAAARGKKAGLRVILNPAPARDLPPDLLANVDILVPNETELAMLSGHRVSDHQSRLRAARVLLEQGVNTIIVTLGDQGALLVTADNARLFPAVEVEVVDTTAAGDAFIGGLASALNQDYSLENAVRFANCAGALAATKLGAQPSLPTAREVFQLYQQSTEQ